MGNQDQGYEIRKKKRGAAARDLATRAIARLNKQGVWIEDYETGDDYVVGKAVRVWTEGGQTHRAEGEFHAGEHHEWNVRETWPRLTDQDLAFARFLVENLGAKPVAYDIDPQTFPEIWLDLVVDVDKRGGVSAWITLGPRKRS